MHATAVLFVVCSLEGGRRVVLLSHACIPSSCLFSRVGAQNDAIRYCRYVRSLIFVVDRGQALLH